MCGLFDMFRIDNCMYYFEFCLLWLLLLCIYKRQMEFSFSLFKVFLVFFMSKVVIIDKIKEMLKEFRIMKIWDIEEEIENVFLGSVYCWMLYLFL